MTKKIRLRYAPSPTGFLHIGNTRTALMNFLFAKHYAGDFIVRIEDTDLERNVEGAIESQFDNLNWLGILPDESFVRPGLNEFGPYKQSEKFARYEILAEQLVKENKAYACFCTSEELEQDYENQINQGIVATKYSRKCAKLTDQERQSKKQKSEPYSIRFSVEEKDLIIDDFIKGEIRFDSKELGDFVILKTNRIATYNFAVVIDDYDMKISHVLRGEEHISNTPRQILIYQAFGWEFPKFGHMSLIIDESGKKLSKRSGNALFFIEQYRNQGYLPKAMFNYISLLGWSPGGEKEIMSVKELIFVFNDKRFSKSPSKFDMNKMKWINSQYMKQLKDNEYLQFTKRFIDQKKFNISNKQEQWINQVLLLFKNEIEFAEQINEHLDIFFNQVDLDAQAKATLANINESQKVIEIFNKLVSKLEHWTIEEIKVAIKQAGIDAQVKGKDLFMPIRIAATHKTHGPSLADVIYLVGRELVKTNILATN